MKKILLSVIALFAAVSMNAQTAVTDDPSFFNLDKSSGWGGHWYDLTEDMNFDASAYEYAWIKFSGNTGKFRFGLTYSEWKSTESWGETFFDAMNVVTDAEGISYIKLEKEKTYEIGGPNNEASPYAGDTWDKHLRQIWTQDDGEEVSVTIDGIYFGTQAELAAAIQGKEPAEGGEEEPAAPAAGEGLVIQIDGSAFVNESAEGAFVDDKENVNVPIAEGTLWGENDAISVSNAFATNHQNVDCKNNDFIKVTIDGSDILAANGLQGQDNPKDADGTGVGVSLNPPTSGAVLAIDAKKDGWVYIVAKLSTNKQYVVFEEGDPIGYKIAMENEQEGVINVELEGEGEYNVVNKENYPEGLPWVIRMYTGNPEAESAGNGLGVFYFPVAEGLSYLASASGSKISWSGIYFSETEAATVTVSKEDGTSLTLVSGDPTGIASAIVKQAANAAIYNLAGQKVDAAYKGIVIKDGKKYIQK